MSSPIHKEPLNFSWHILFRVIMALRYMVVGDVRLVACETMGYESSFIATPIERVPVKRHYEIIERAASIAP